jgi:predicted nucleic acid-binding protein
VTAPGASAAEHIVVDASVMVDLLARTEMAPRVAARLHGRVWHAPALFDAEVLSALGRLHRANLLTVRFVDDAIRRLVKAPVTRHELPPLLTGAWAHRGALRLSDALYASLATRLRIPLVTTDARLAHAFPDAEVISG